MVLALLALLAEWGLALLELLELEVLELELLVTQPSLYQAGCDVHAQRHTAPGAPGSYLRGWHLQTGGVRR